LYSALSCTPKAGGQAGGLAVKPPRCALVTNRSRRPTACTHRPEQSPDR